MRPTFRSSALVFLLAVLAWAPSVGSPFWLDDYLQVERAAALWTDPGGLADGFRFSSEDVSPLWLANRSWSVTYFRPLVQLVFALDWGLWGNLAWGYHATNLLLHGIAAVLVALLAARLSGRPGAGLLAGLIFAVHPSHQDSVAWITGRTDVVATIAFLAALWAHLRWRGGDRAAGVAAPILLAAAFLAKESAAAFALVAALLGAAEPSAGGVRARIASALRAAWPSVLLTLFYLGARLAAGGFGNPSSAYLITPADPGFAATALWRTFLYAANLVFGVPIEPVVVGPALAARPWAVCVLVALLVGAIGWAQRRARPDRGVLLGLAIFVLTLAPAIGVVAGQRFLYLPSAGFACAIGAAFGGWIDARRWVVGGICLLLVAASWVKIAFRDDLIRDTMAPLHALASRSIAPGPGERLYFVDLPPLVCMGFAAAVRNILRLPRVEVRALTLAPDLPPSVSRWVGSAPGDGGETRLGRDRQGRLIVERVGGEYFASFMERFFLWGEKPPAPGTRLRAGELAVEIGAAGGRGGVQALAFDIEGGVDAARNWILRCSPGTVERIEPAQLPLVELRSVPVAGTMP